MEPDRDASSALRRARRTAPAMAGPSSLPSLPHEALRLTRGSYDRCHGELMERAGAYFRQVAHPAGGMVP